MTAPTSTTDSTRTSGNPGAFEPPTSEAVTADNPYPGVTIEDVIAASRKPKNSEDAAIFMVGAAFCIALTVFMIFVCTVFDSSRDVAISRGESPGWYEFSAIVSASIAFGLFITAIVCVTKGGVQYEKNKTARTVRMILQKEAAYKSQQPTDTVDSTKTIPGRPAAAILDPSTNIDRQADLLAAQLDYERLASAVAERIDYGQLAEATARRNQV